MLLLSFATVTEAGRVIQINFDSEVDVTEMYRQTENTMLNFQGTSEMAIKAGKRVFIGRYLHWRTENSLMYLSNLLRYF